ncbi:MAG: AzlC family ABC transporter permease [Syntrophaceae bacterium]|nr:AzlC family ABC transporter permease [Syntrophaceae bacterium]
MDDHPFRDGAKAALPVVLGYLPVGVAFGILARKAGFNAFETGLMSLLVYAGASQFIAVEMISKGILWFPIVLTTFFVNLRHLLMSSTLSVYLKKSRIWTLGLLSAQLTDESFAVAVSDTSKILDRPFYLLGLQITSHLAWISGSVGGAFFGSVIDHRKYGLPFALPALFICLLMIQIKGRDHVGIMVMAGIFSLFFKWAFPGNWCILLATLFASVIGMVIKLKVQGSKLKNSSASALIGEGEGGGE